MAAAVVAMAVDTRARFTAALALAAAVSVWTGIPPAHAEQPAAAAGDVDADNTAKNVRDRDEGSVTPLDQSEKQADLEVTQAIRKGLMDGDDFSTNAKNVKVVTSEDGRVTLRGPVDSSAEKAQVVSLAKNVAGPKRQVVDQLEVAAP